MTTHPGDPEVVLEYDEDGGVVFDTMREDTVKYSLPNILDTNAYDYGLVEVSIANLKDLGEQTEMISIDSSSNAVVFNNIIELFPEEDSEMTLEILLTDSTENVSTHFVKLIF